MQNLIRGQKVKLSDLFNKNQLRVGLSVSASNLTLDISCFGVDDKNKLSDDRYFIFYNQKISPCGSLSSTGARNGDQEQFDVDLSRLPSTVRKLVFVITIDGNGVMSQIHDGYLRLLDRSTELVRFSFSSSDFKDEKAIMVGEIYFKDIWRFSAVGQGFNGGLSALLKHFGGEEVVALQPIIPSKKVALGKQLDDSIVNISSKPSNPTDSQYKNWSQEQIAEWKCLIEWTTDEMEWIPVAQKQNPRHLKRWLEKGYVKNPYEIYESPKSLHDYVKSIHYSMSDLTNGSISFFSSYTFFSNQNIKIYLRLAGNTSSFSDIRDECIDNCPNYILSELVGIYEKIIFRLMLDDANKLREIIKSTEELNRKRRPSND